MCSAAATLVAPHGKPKYLLDQDLEPPHLHHIRTRGQQSLIQTSPSLRYASSRYACVLDLRIEYVALLFSIESISCLESCHCDLIVGFVFVFAAYRDDEIWNRKARCVSCRLGMVAYRCFGYLLEGV